MSSYDLTGCQVKGLAEIYLKYFGYIEDGYCVEVGAFNGKNWSNTWGLIQVGWRGLLVEPNPDHYHDLVKEYKGNSKVTTLPYAIGSYDGLAKLYLGGSNTTIKPEMIDIYNSIWDFRTAQLDEEKFVWVPIFELDSVLEDHNCPQGFEVLVVDVEGAEMDVLNSFDLEQWQPKIAIVETHEQYPDKRLNQKAAKVDEYFKTYEKVYADHINSVYVR
jgi:FkbM family methyltransferase